MKKVSRLIISSMILCTVLFNVAYTGYGQCMYSKYIINERDELKDAFTEYNFKNICNTTKGYLSEYNKDLSILNISIRKKEQTNDADVAFLYDTIIYNTFILNISESIREYSDDSKVKKIAKKIIKSTDETLMRSGILFEILREIPDDNIQKEKQYEEECYEFSLNKVADMSKIKGTDEELFLEAVKCHHECTVKMCESIIELSSRKEVKEIAKNLMNSCNKRMDTINKM